MFLGLIDSGQSDKFHRLIDRYYLLIEAFNLLSSNESDQHDQLFDLSSKIMALEALSFIIPFLKHDLKLEIQDLKLIDKWSEARLKTEKLFHTQSPINQIWKNYSHIPKHFTGYLPNQPEYLIFNDRFIYNLNIIKIFQQTRSQKSKRPKILSGKPTYLSDAIIHGQVKIINSWQDFDKFQKGDILVAPMTTPDYLPIIHLAAAIITNEGGVLCHAAIVSREFQIPCIVGTQVATQTLKDNDLVEIDMARGIVSNKKPTT